MPDPARAERLPQHLRDGVVHLEPLDEQHREPLRAACAADPAIWEIYPVSFAGAAFDPAFDDLIDAAGRVPFAAFAGGVLVGMTGYLHIEPRHRVLEIGGTYLAPDARGTGVNRHFKRLLIDHAFACGFHRIEFRVDARNLRSQAAVEKLGATREGVLRDQMVTWTGFVRDTVVFSILEGEWLV
jgi:RimJ/RimL family protein N-acetyltransferase